MSYVSRPRLTPAHQSPQQQQPVGHSRPTLGRVTVPESPMHPTVSASAQQQPGDGEGPPAVDDDSEDDLVDVQVPPAQQQHQHHDNTYDDEQEYTDPQQQQQQLTRAPSQNEGLMRTQQLASNPRSPSMAMESAASPPVRAGGGRATNGNNKSPREMEVLQSQRNQQQQYRSAQRPSPSPVARESGRSSAQGRTPAASPVVPLSSSLDGRNTDRRNTNHKGNRNGQVDPQRSSSRYQQQQMQQRDDAPLDNADEYENTRKSIGLTSVANFPIYPLSDRSTRKLFYVRMIVMGLNLVQASFFAWGALTVNNSSLFAGVTVYWGAYFIYAFFETPACHRLLAVCVIPHSDGTEKTAERWIADFKQSTRYFWFIIIWMLIMLIVMSYDVAVIVVLVPILFTDWNRLVAEANGDFHPTPWKIVSTMTGTIAPPLFGCVCVLAMVSMAFMFYLLILHLNALNVVNYRARVPKGANAAQDNLCDGRSRPIKVGVVRFEWDDRKIDDENMPFVDEVDESSDRLVNDYPEQDEASNQV